MHGVKKKKKKVLDQLSKDLETCGESDAEIRETHSLELCMGYTPPWGPRLGSGVKDN